MKNWIGIGFLDAFCFSDQTWQSLSFFFFSSRNSGLQIQRCIKDCHDIKHKDGGVDTTVIDSRQHKLGQMADFPPLLASSIFDL